MWLTDTKVRDLIETWKDRECLEDRCLATAAAELEELIDRESERMPPPSTGSEKCMIYKKVY